MNSNIDDLIEKNFSESDRSKVRKALLSITLDHVMARSQTNLDNTWKAIIQLSKGSSRQVRYFVQAAKKDFRDVIYWSTLDERENT